MADIAVVNGSKILRTYCAETVPGTPVAGVHKTLRVTPGVSFNLNRKTFASNELRQDRQISSLTYGTRSGEVSLPIEWSYGSFDDFIEAVMCGTWTGDVLTIGNVKRTFSFEEKATDYGIVERYVGGELGSLSISQQSDAMVTGNIKGIFRDAKIAQTAGVNLAYDATGKTITRASSGFITTDGWYVGAPVTGLGNADVGNNNTTPWIITSLTETVMTFTTAAGIVTKASAAGITLNMGTLASSVTSPTTTRQFDSLSGSVSEGGAASSIITTWDMSVEQTVSPLFALGNAGAVGSSAGQVTVKGSISAYFVDQELRKKFANGLTTSLSLVMGGAGFGGQYTFDLGTVYLTSSTKNGDDKEVIQKIDYQATYNAANASTLKITRAAM